jgi:molybdate transport system substrate-binding protein
VLIAPKDEPVTLKIAKGFDLAGTLGDGKLATGDPKSVPVGLYAQEALTNLGVWDAVSPKIAATDNVRSALAFVARGEAKLGIVYKTDSNSEPKVTVVDTFPADTHKPIVYPFALTASSKNPNAEAFLAYLQSPQAAKVFEGEGFVVLKK